MRRSLAFLLTTLAVIAAMLPLSADPTPATLRKIHLPIIVQNHE